MTGARASQAQAAACLQNFFHQQVAEAMPKAIRAALADAATLGDWLHQATMHIKPGLFGPLDAADEPMLGGLSASTLVVLLFDQRQPAAITVAARDVLLGRYLSDDDVQALAIAQANRMAQQAVQDLHAAQHRQREQLQRAEDQSLYGGEHAVTGVAPVVLSTEMLEAADEMNGVAR